MNHFSSTVHSQRGLTMVLVMLLLAIMTLIEVSAFSRVMMSERASSNTRNHALAFHAAESALRSAEDWLVTQNTPPTPVSTCASAPCTVWARGTLPTLKDQTHTWWQTNGTAYGSTLSGVNSQPRYIIEQVDFVPHGLSAENTANNSGTYYYRITARGTGGTDVSQSMVESTFSVFFN